ncbi:hypothetical protein BDV09DRAFT_180492 [Aspergillus tetrazonus]
MQDCLSAGVGISYIASSIVGAPSPAIGVACLIQRPRMPRINSDSIIARTISLQLSFSPSIVSEVLHPAISRGMQLLAVAAQI